MLDNATDFVRFLALIPFFGVLLILTLLAAGRPVTKRGVVRWLDRCRLPTSDAAVEEARPSLRRLRTTLAIGFLPALLTQPYSPIVLFAVPYLIDDRARRRAAGSAHPPSRLGGWLSDRLQPRALAWHEWLAVSLAVAGVAGATVAVVFAGFDAVTALGYSTLACGGAALLVVFGAVPNVVAGAESDVARCASERLRLAALGSAWYAVVFGLSRVAQASADALGDDAAADVLLLIDVSLEAVAVALLVGLVFLIPNALLARGRPVPPSHLPPPPRW